MVGNGFVLLGFLLLYPDEFFDHFTDFPEFWRIVVIPRFAMGLLYETGDRPRRMIENAFAILLRIELPELFGEPHYGHRKSGGIEIRIFVLSFVLTYFRTK